MYNALIIKTALNVIMKAPDKEKSLIRIPSRVPENLETQPKNRPKGIDCKGYYRDMETCFEKNCLILSIILGEYQNV